MTNSAQTASNRLEELTEDYTLEPVPGHINTTGWRVAMVICAIGITLPAIWVSSDMAIHEGFGPANWAFWLGNAVVALAGIFTAIIGSRSRLSTYMILQFSFGPTGAKLVNLLMAVTLLGWFASTSELFGMALDDGLFELSGVRIGPAAAIIITSVLMTATTIWGYSMVERFSILSVPLLLAFMIYVAFLAGSSAESGVFSAVPEGGSPQVILISITIGMAALTAVLMPDFTRYCPNDKESIIASVVGIGITYPMVMTMASVPAVVTGEADFTYMMLGMGVVFSALVVLIFATWSTNITNLYSSTLTLSTFMPKVPSWQITIGGAIFATTLAVFGVVEQYFIPFLLFLGFAS
ncbi:MAG: cytosine permease, partial [Pseudomonadota bacterium]